MVWVTGVKPLYEDAVMWRGEGAPLMRERRPLVFLALVLATVRIGNMRRRKRRRSRARRREEEEKAMEEGNVSRQIDRVFDSLLKGSVMEILGLFHGFVVRSNYG